MNLASPGRDDKERDSGIAKYTSTMAVIPSYFERGKLELLEVFISWR